MRIIFCITTLGHGKGGHFFSLRSIAEQLGKDHEVQIVNFGRSPSPVFVDTTLPYRFIPYHGWDWLSTAVRFRKLLQLEKPDVVHAFDVPAYGVARAAAPRSLVLAMTQCGGPNPRRYYPKVDDLMVFSQENLDFFRGHRRWRHSHIEWIPNRVTAIMPDMARVAALRAAHRLNDEKILLRISRICRHYQSSFEQGIRLLKYLLDRGEHVKLILLGVREDPAVR